MTWTLCFLIGFLNIHIQQYERKKIKKKRSKHGLQDFIFFLQHAKTKKLSQKKKETEEVASQVQARWKQWWQEYMQIN